MISLLKAIPLLIAGILVLGFLSLGFVPESGRLIFWYLIPLAMMGMVFFAVGTVIYMAVRKRWKSRLGWATVCVSLALTTFPFFMSYLRYPSDLKSTTPSLTVRVPMDGPVRVAWGGDRVAINYHAAYPDQRWAYDLLVEPYNLGTERLEDYGCFGKPVFAPYSGRIIKAYDGDADQVPSPVPPEPENISGNHVVIEPEGFPRTYLEIAHLKLGSVEAETGQQVTEGDVIGACGNSGNTTEPHVHIHFAQFFMDEDLTFSSGLPLYFRDHEGPTMPSGGYEETEDGMVVFTGDVITHMPDVE